jgi:hypothetical protein
MVNVIKGAEYLNQRAPESPVRVADAQYFHQQREGVHSGHVLSPNCPPIANVKGGDNSIRITGLGGAAGGEVKREAYHGRAGVNSRGVGRE